MKKSDLLIALGERLTDTVSQSYTFPTAPKPQLPLVHIWPDANEVGRVWHPTLGIPASPNEVINGLLSCGAPKIPKERKAWIDKLNSIHSQLTDKTWDTAADGVNFAAVVSEVDKHLSDTATITTDAGNFGSFVHRYINFKQSHIFLSSVVGAMGSGVPMAVAAGLRRPNDQIVCFIGDGGMLMMGNEIATARQYNINPTIIISDNSMYGTIGMHSYVRYPDRSFMNATQLTNPNFAKWAESFGAIGLTIVKENEIEEKISQAFSIKDRPVVVHCKTSALQMSAWRRYEEGDSLP
ncbi:MAG: thiamine pyrophosphate-dependent enzyme, partial [Pseudomonadota bacterium]|nr:thiamine pyrophosphate-dependent enzyme [Pseudomonadota bacterium]